MLDASAHSYAMGFALIAALQPVRMNVHAPYTREGTSRPPAVPPRLRQWARCFGALFAIGTFLSMASSVEWRLWLVLTDPLAWMMLVLAAAAGVTAGYALGCRVLARRTA
ncbi:hypothetical protein [Dyella jiangningensis]